MTLSALLNRDALSYSATLNHDLLHVRRASSCSSVQSNQRLNVAATPEKGSYILLRRLWLSETNHASMSMMYEHFNRPNPERQRRGGTGQPRSNYRNTESSTR
jgi:hypothetical protein